MRRLITGIDSSYRRCSKPRGTGRRRQSYWIPGGGYLLLEAQTTGTSRKKKLGRRPCRWRRVPSIGPGFQGASHSLAIGRSPVFGELSIALSWSSRFTTGKDERSGAIASRHKSQRICWPVEAIPHRSEERRGGT